jgi:hypothetical protein
MRTADLRREWRKFLNHHTSQLRKLCKSTYGQLRADLVTVAVLWDRGAQRGVIVPIVDLRCRFGQGLTESTPLHVVIIVRITEFCPSP